ncbi:MAG: ImmA/IrrE family metallo-endopeptidase [Cyclobacteriaceae bacterium]|nr:ImmA/IrrE family metallo-endopeptidase [Cyclobacteriaceae bacterium]
MKFISSVVTQAAKDFWKRAGRNGVFPCDISGAVNLVLPIDIICLSELSLKKIQLWLTTRKVFIDLEIDDRLLHGFILISRGCGFIFINGTDTEEERRYTIAHEASHFLLDYKFPRELAVRKLGESILEVMDGYREPTLEERIDGALTSVTIKPYTHLLEKTGDGTFDCLNIQHSENEADALALELLAPSATVIKDTNPNKTKISFYDFKNQCYHILRSKYLIPDSIAEAYSSKLAYVAKGAPSLVSRLGF